MNDIMFKILLTVISTICVIITSVIVPYVRGKISSEKIEIYSYWASLVVDCAEMIYKEKGSGKTKKEYATTVLNSIINKNKTVLTEEQINALIESAVKAMNSQG